MRIIDMNFMVILFLVVARWTIPSLGGDYQPHERTKVRPIDTRRKKMATPSARPADWIGKTMLLDRRPSVEYWWQI